MSIFSRLTEKPWLAGDGPQLENPFASTPPKKIGLVIFLFVVSSMFFLFIASYMFRMEYADWRPLRDSQILWFNTLVLIASSITFQRARNAAERDHRQDTIRNLSTAGVLTLIFLSGQLLVWQRITSTGYAPLGDPASAFFFLLTGVHGLHLLGGLYVWLKTLLRITHESSVMTAKLAVELCSLYWHFLLLVWLLLFSLLLAT